MMEYLDLDIEAFDYRKEGATERFRVRVASSPIGEQRLSSAEEVVLPLQLRSWIRHLELRKLELSELIALGESLADLLFPPNARSFLVRSRSRLDPGHGLRIRLHLETYALADIPWEYVYIPRSDALPDQKTPDGFLVLDRLVSLVRSEVIDQPLASLDSIGEEPLRLTVLLSNPLDPKFQTLDLVSEYRNVEESLAKVQGIKVESWPKATLTTLEESLIGGAQIFHFAGHGEFVGNLGASLGTEEGKVSLVFEDEVGKSVLLPVEKLAQSLVDRSIRLTVLGACNTGRRDGVCAWTGVAPALIRAGIPAVVAMQYTIHDRNAIAFNRRFYNALTSARTIDSAVSDGRLAIFNRSDLGERDWGVPVLYLRTTRGVLFPEIQPEIALEAGEIKGFMEETHEQLPDRTTVVDTSALKHTMLTSFNLEELEALCWEVEESLVADGIALPLSLEMVGGESKTAIVMNLIKYLERRGYLEYLSQAVRSRRPGRVYKK